MITAKKTKFSSSIASWLAKQLLNTHFSAMFIKGLPAIQTQGHFHDPILLLANHSCRWDTPIIYYLVQSILKVDCYIMMGSDAIRHYPIARSLGCFEVDASTPIASAQSIEYAASLARGQSHCLVVFPQGRYFRNHKRPLNFTLGAAQLARKIKNLRILPIALCYDNFTSELPEVFVNIGDSIYLPEGKMSTQELTSIFQMAVTAELDELQTEVANNSMENFKNVLPGKNSIYFWLLKKMDPKWEKRALQNAKHDSKV